MIHIVCTVFLSVYEYIVTGLFDERGYGSPGLTI